MPLVKMKYGIDLGTTNSSLCKFENSDTTIIKTDTLKNTMPSCVSFHKNRIVKVGDSAYNDLRAEKARATKKWLSTNQNVFIEFKRTMGLDTKYKSSNTRKSFSSEELSAEVLKTLLSFVKDEQIHACVITIPAKFKSDQIAATKRAATLAGIAQCELLQEPIAAAIAYGVSAKEKDGLWVVFDFGGGTFDAALLNVQDGILQVKDTEGDNYLGGKNLDFAIVDNILIPYLQEQNSIDRILAKAPTTTILRESLKFYAEQAKNQLSQDETCDITSQLDEFGTDDDGNEIELDLTIDREQVNAVMTPFFQKAVDITKRLLERNNVSGDQITSLILVGGPTHAPLLRQMLSEQITPNINTSVDPMTAVALGSALYASTIDYNEDIAVDTSSNVVALDLSYESNSVELVEYVTVKPLPDESKGPIPNNLTVELVRDDNAWSSGKVSVSSEGEVIECYLQEDKPNTFTVNAYDDQGVPINCFPKEVHILQGTKIANAVLPYYIGIEVTNFHTGKDIFVSLKGLEKNVLIPAVGVINGLKTPRVLNAGNSSDKFIIPIYQGEYDANGTSAVYNDPVFDVIITGEDVSETIPITSDLDIILKVDRSQMMTFEATFPITGETIEKTIDVSQRKGVERRTLKHFYTDARDNLEKLKESKKINKEELSHVEQILKDVDSRYKAEKNFDDGRMHLLADIRRAFLEMEKVEKLHEWERVEEDLDERLSHLIEANNDLGNEHDDEVENAKKQVKRVKETKDVKQGKQTVEMLEELYVHITYVYQVMNFIRDKYTNFDPSDWSNPEAAHKILMRAYGQINSGKVNGMQVRRFIGELYPLLVMSKNNKALQF